MHEVVAVGLEAVFRGLQRGRRSAISPVDDAEGVAVWVWAGHDEFAAVGAADTDNGRPMRLGPKEAGP